MLLPLVIALQLTTPPHQSATNTSVSRSPMVAKCEIAGSEVFDRLANLPNDVRDRLVGTFDDGFAEVGSAFDSTDLDYAGQPSRRFLRAYHLGTQWMIWYEHGGWGYHWHAIGMRKWPDARPVKLDRTAKYDGGDAGLCAASKAYFAGAGISEDM